MSADEIVLCIPATARPWFGIDHGFNPSFDAELRELLGSVPCCWIPKARAERDETWLQLIPYCVLARDDKLLSYRRGEACGEDRLRGKLAFGIGGHVDRALDVEIHDQAVPPGVAAGAAVRRALWRELGEELEISHRGPASFRPKFRGFIFDADTEVGRVHLGLAYLIALPRDAEVRSIDPAVCDLAWDYPLGYAAARNGGAAMEGWTGIVLDNSTGGQILG